MSICTSRTVARCSGSIEPVCSHCSCPEATICQASRIFSSLLNRIGTPHTTHYVAISFVISPEKTEGLTATAPLPLGGSPKEKKTRGDPAPATCERG